VDTDTFVTTCYVIVDDLLKALSSPVRQHRRGRPLLLSDSEFITLMLLAQWHGRGSERAALRCAQERFATYFPRISGLGQSSFNKRARSLWQTLARIGPAVTERIVRLDGGDSGAYEALDCTAIPLMSRRRGERTRLFGRDEATIGRGGVDQGWYYGVKLCIAVTMHGCATGFLAGPANTGDRWMAEGLLRWRAAPDSGQPAPEELAAVLGPTHRRGGARTGPTGPLWPPEGAGEQRGEAYLADLGFAGDQWVSHWAREYGSIVFTPRSAAKPAGLNSRRQPVETTFHLLIDRLHLRFPRARTMSGLYARIAAKIAALNVGILANRLWGYPNGTLVNPIA